MVKMIRALAIVGAVFILTGCASQVSALAPVSGDDVASVRTAANDVLLDHQIAILRAPVCTKDKTAISCTGETGSNEAISVTSPLDGTMTVKVGKAQIFQGSVADVLDVAARGGR